MVDVITIYYLYAKCYVPLHKGNCYDIDDTLTTTCIQEIVLQDF